MSTNQCNKCSLSVIILTDNRDEYLKRCLSSISKSLNYINKSEKVEIILIGHEISGEYKDFADKLIGKDKIKYCEINIKEKSLLRNYGIKNAHGEIIYFIDDDVVVSNNFLNKVIQKFKESPEAVAIGGPNLNPRDSAVFERVQGYVLGSAWGSAKMRRRYRLSGGDVQADQSALSLCNLGFRREILEKEEIQFDPRLHYNEENNLLRELETRGYNMLFSPEIIVYHYRRRTIMQYSKQVLSSGRGRAMSIKIDKINFGVLYFLPLFFVLYIFCLPVFLKCNSIFLVPFIVYTFITLCASGYIFLIRERNILVFILSFLLYFLSHLCYGIGLIAGFLMPFKKYEDFS